VLTEAPAGIVVSAVRRRIPIALCGSEDAPVKPVKSDIRIPYPPLLLVNDIDPVLVLKATSYTIPLPVEFINPLMVEAKSIPLYC